MEYYILKKNGKVEYGSKEWCNVKAYILGRKSKEGYTLSSIVIGDNKARISQVYDLESFLEPNVKFCRTLVEIPLKDLEMLVKEAVQKGAKKLRKDGHLCGCRYGGYEGR